MEHSFGIPRAQRPRWLATRGQQLIDLFLGIRVCTRPRFAQRIVNLDLIRNRRVREFCRLVQEFPAIAEDASPLELVRLFRSSDRDLVELVAWLSLAPKCVRRSIPPAAEILLAVELRGVPSSPPELPAWERQLRHALATKDSGLI